MEDRGGLTGFSLKRGFPESVRNTCEDGISNLSAFPWTWCFGEI